MKKGEKKKIFRKGGKKKMHNHKEHPIFRIPKTFGQKAADWITKWAGSWTFILGFFAFLGLWVFTNGYFLLRYIKDGVIDPYPFILLNLFLSCLAAIQAPVILMSQNRENQMDRERARYDYAINKKAEKEIREIKNILLRERKKK